jgi:CRISPR-associated endonuclease Cas2
MHICLIYDISGDRLRSQVSRHCERVGLVRLQKSVFVGQISPVDLSELEQAYRPILPVTDRFAIMYLTETMCNNLLKNAGAARISDLALPSIDWYF